MVETQTAPTPLAPLLLRNILLPLYIYSDKTLINLSHKFKVFHIIRYTLITAFLFFLKVIPSFISSSLRPNQNQNHHHNHNSDAEFDSDSSTYPWVPFLKGPGNCNDATDGSLVDETCIARALTQLLALINEIPVSSRKYEIVRSYAEKLMDENLEVGYEPLRKVNAKVLSAAFSRALQQLELATEAGAAAAKYDSEINTGGDVTKTGGGGYFGLNQVIKTVGHYGDFAWTQFTKPKTRLRASAEKLSAELLWLAEKLAACGSADEAVRQWASASKLACMALSAQQRLQGSLVKLSVFLFKEAESMGGEDDDVEELRKIKTNLLTSWLPFLCRATIGVEAPILTFNEKTQLENVLGKLIESLKHEEEQEKVLSLWLHHYAHCSSSDWPNLHHYFDRWCIASRNLLILEAI